MGGVTPDWLAQLAPDHAPPPPGWWPPAPGWWVLLGLLLAILFALLYWWKHPTSRLRRAALRELNALQIRAGDGAALAGALENLTRRYAVTRYGRDTVAHLSGERWIAFVVRHGGKRWAGGIGTSLLRAAYGGTATEHRDAWLKGARAFIKGRSWFI